MVNISDLRVGDKVHYIPFPDCDPSTYENGIIKEIPENSVTEVRVVFKCAGDWENFKDYTSALTSVKQLEKGWYTG